MIIPRILLDALDWCRRWREVLLGGGGRGWSSTGWWNGGLQTRSRAKNRNRSIEMARTCQNSPSFLRTPPATGHFTVARTLLLHARALTEWRWQSRKIIIGNGQCGQDTTPPFNTTTTSHAAPVPRSLVEPPHSSIGWRSCTPSSERGMPTRFRTSLQVSTLSIQPIVHQFAAFPPFDPRASQSKSKDH